MEKPAYIEVSLTTSPPLLEPALALLAGIGFEGFEETHSGLKAYIPLDQYNETQLQEALSVFASDEWYFESQEIPPTNWNEVWESHFEAVYVEGFCQIISGFHVPDPTFPYTILIDPKMSFGTGHHATTRLVVRHLQKIPVAGITVLDMGCGTGILGILAAKMGATSVLGIDIDPWSFENGNENVERNMVREQVSIQLGDVRQIPAQYFELILANINRNVLFSDLPHYEKHLAPNGEIVLSGFFTEDEPEMIRRTSALGLAVVTTLREENWSAIRLKKQQKQPLK